MNKIISSVERDNAPQVVIVDQDAKSDRLRNYLGYWGIADSIQKGTCTLCLGTNIFSNIPSTDLTEVENANIELAQDYLDMMLKLKFSSDISLADLQFLIRPVISNVKILKHKI